MMNDKEIHTAYVRRATRVLQNKIYRPTLMEQVAGKSVELGYQNRAERKD
jgi:hypothetical protein